jgi:hypothetical protein
MEDSLTGELAEYQEQFRANRADAEQLCTDMSSRQFNWRAATGRWSVAECLVHLNLSADLLSKLSRDAAARARARGVLGSGPFRYGPVSRWMLRSMEPPIRKRYKTRRCTGSPTEAFEVQRVLEEFRVAGQQWEECLHEASGLDLSRVKVRLPGLMRFQLGALVAGQAMHERRHLWQAREVTEAVGFPSD